MLALRPIATVRIARSGLVVVIAGVFSTITAQSLPLMRVYVAALPVWIFGKSVFRLLEREHTNEVPQLKEQARIIARASADADIAM